MAKKKYIISLTPEERETLEQLTTTGKAPAYKMNHARILLKAELRGEMAYSGRSSQSISPLGRAINPSTLVAM